MITKRENQHRYKGYALLEVLISLAILLAGIIAILNFFPFNLRSINDAAMLTESSLLAQEKAEEIRRDNVSSSSDIIDYIRTLTSPIPADGVTFAENPNLTYSFCGISLIDPIDDPGDPRDDVGVARVIIRKSKKIDPKMKVIYELEFDK